MQIIFYVFRFVLASISRRDAVKIASPCSLVGNSIRAQTDMDSVFAINDFNIHRSYGNYVCEGFWSNSCGAMYCIHPYASPSFVSLSPAFFRSSSIVLHCVRLWFNARTTTTTAKSVICCSKDNKIPSWIMIYSDWYAFARSPNAMIITMQRIACNSLSKCTIRLKHSTPFATTVQRSRRWRWREQCLIISLLNGNWMRCRCRCRMPMYVAECVCVSVSNRYCVQFVAFSGVTLFFFIFSVAFTRAHTHKKAQAASEEHGEKRATSCARRNTFNILCWLSVFVVAPNGAMAVHTPNTTRQTMWQTKGIRETNTQHWMWVMQLKRDRTCSWTKPSQIYAHF